MRVLVTGAAGFIGSSICEALLKNGDNVLGIDNLTEYYSINMKRNNLEALQAYQNFKFCNIDLSVDNLHEPLEGVNRVFHQAGQPGVRKSWGSDFASYTVSNVLATQRILEACKDSSDLEAFVAASSSSVYGTADRYPTSESDLPNPISPYGVTKLASEHLCSLYGTQFNVPTISLRYFTVYGPRQRPDMAIHKLINAASTGCTFELNGDGNQRRDFTYINDVVRANELASQYVSTTDDFGKVVNVGGGASITVRELVSQIEDLVGEKVPITSISRAMGDPYETGADNSLAERMLGWKPQTSIRTGLKSQIEYQLREFGSGQ